MDLNTIHQGAVAYIAHLKGLIISNLTTIHWAALCENTNVKLDVILHQDESLGYVAQAVACGLPGPSDVKIIASACGGSKHRTAFDAMHELWINVQSSVPHNMAKLKAGDIYKGPSEAN